MPTRRTKGTGSIWQRGRIWWFAYTKNGIRVPESSGSEDRDEAQRQLLVRLGELAAGRDVTPEKATIADLCALVLADYRLRKLRDIATVKWRYEAHIEPAIGSLPTSRFTPRQVRLYVDMRRRESASDATINRELAIIRRAFSLALREDPPLVRRAPYILKLEEDNTRQGFIEQGQYLTLRAALPEHLKALLVIGYHCGNRIGELRKLRWSQVDMAAAEIRIERKQAKGKKPRVLPIYGDMHDWLEWQRKRHAPGCDLVFHWHGKPLGSHLKGWDKACTAAGLNGLHFHDLRRSAVRNMERAGIPRHVAMSISGHRTEAVYRRYDIVVESDLKDAGEKLAAYHKSQRPKLRRVK
ncbi:MAG: site-specific integrase [Acidobacteriales bacterium]|nr:site-specific integrase [Terriglobales bacterium]